MRRIEPVTILASYDKHRVCHWEKSDDIVISTGVPIKINSRTYIIAIYECVSHASELMLADGKYDITYVGGYPEYNIALLRIIGKGIDAINMSEITTVQKANKTTLMVNHFNPETCESRSMTIPADCDMALKSINSHRYNSGVCAMVSIDFDSYSDDLLSSLAGTPLVYKRQMLGMVLSFDMDVSKYICLHSSVIKRMCMEYRRYGTIHTAPQFKCDTVAGTIKAMTSFSDSTSIKYTIPYDDDGTSLTIGDVTLCRLTESIITYYVLKGYKISPKIISKMSEKKMCREVIIVCNKYRMVDDHLEWNIIESVNDHKINKLKDIKNIKKREKIEKIMTKDGDNIFFS